eukprot:6463030-Amphidinium_carterae.1
MDVLMMFCLAPQMLIQRSASRFAFSTNKDFVQVIPACGCHFQCYLFALSFLAPQSLTPHCYHVFTSVFVIRVLLHSSFPRSSLLAFILNLTVFCESEEMITLEMITMKRMRD